MEREYIDYLAKIVNLQDNLRACNLFKMTKDNNKKVKVTMKNVEESVEVDKGARLMEVTKEEGWPIAYGCEDGMCGTCIIKGDGGLSEMDEKEKISLDVMGLGDEDYRLACQCFVEGDTTIEQ